MRTNQLACVIDNFKFLVNDCEKYSTDPELFTYY